MLPQPVPHAEARRRIAGKPIVTRDVFEGLLPELQARAFLVTGVEHANVLQRVRDLTAELPAGGDFQDLKADILGELSPWLIDPAADPEERAKQESAASRRAELLLRMHGWQAYAQTNYEALEAHTDVFPYRQYLSSEDARVRATHAALNRKIIPAGDPFWQNHTPPWEFGCRCDVVGITAEEAAEIAAGETSLPLEQREVIQGPALEELHNGKLRTDEGGTLDIRTPREKNGHGYEWRPADQSLDIDQILARYDAPVRADFEAWARGEILPDGRTAWEAFTGEAPATPSPTPGPSSAESPRKTRKTHPAERMRKRIATAAYKSESAIGTGVNGSYRVRNGVEVVFKPASEEHQGVLRLGIQPGEQYKREKAASIIDQYLGTELVPPVEIIDWRGKTGSAMAFRSGWVEAVRRHQQHRPPRFDQETMRRMSLLDEVLGHLDRHGGNLMVRKRRGSDYDDVIMIDNGLCLSTHPEASGTRFPVPLHGDPLDAASHAQLDRFVARRSEWEPLITPLVGPQAVHEIIRRIDRLKTAGFGHIAPRLL